jgi:hypothetical protein
MLFLYPFQLGLLMEKLICEHCGTKLIAALLLAKTVAGVWIYQICAVGLT